MSTIPADPHPEVSDGDEEGVSVGPELAAKLLRRVEEARRGEVITIEQLWAELDAQSGDVPFNRTRPT